MGRQEYRGGIGVIGVEKVAKFAREGGTVICLGDAIDFAIEKLRLPAENLLKGAKRETYFAPGSLFRMNLDKHSSLTYGLEKTVSVYKNRSLVLALKPYPKEIVETGFFDDRNLLQSGWAVGEEKLHNKIGLAEIPVGDGRVLLYAFRPQHRGQTYGTFKLLFNAFYGPSL